MFLRAMCFFSSIFKNKKRPKKPDKKTNKNLNKQKKIILTKKIWNDFGDEIKECLCYICQLFHGEKTVGERGEKTLTLQKKKKTLKKGGERKVKTIRLESKELPESESGDVIPIYSGYEFPFFLSLALFLSFTHHFSPSVSFSIYLCCFYQCIL